jgi:exocyst complex component 3
MSSHPARRYSVLLGSSTSGNDEETNEIIEEPDMDYQQTNVESFEAAAKAVADMLSKPEQLDSLDQIRMNFSRKKTTVETQLRNAVQTQLDGVQNGLVGLKIAGDTIGDIKERMGQVEEVYKQCEELSDIIGPLKEANRRYQQLRTTDVHINNIFGVPHAVEEIRQMIEGGNLLEAHQLWVWSLEGIPLSINIHYRLSELEHTRDELLIQLYQSSDAFVDRNTVGLYM